MIYTVNGRHIRRESACLFSILSSAGGVIWQTGTFEQAAAICRKS